MRRTMFFIAIAGLVALTIAAEPFRLPVSAEPDSAAPASGGWTSSGTMKVSYMLARRQLAVALAVAGWTHRHSIPVGSHRMVESWVRGEDELTMVTWRISAGKSGYSFGVTRQERGADPHRRERF